MERIAATAPRRLRDLLGFTRALYRATVPLTRMTRGSRLESIGKGLRPVLATRAAGNKPHQDAWQLRPRATKTP